MSRARLHPAGYDIGPAGAVTWQPSDSYLPPIVIGYAHTPAGRAAIIETLGAGLSPSGLDGKTPPGDINTLSAIDREIMAEMGLSEEDYRKANGLTAA